MKNYIVNNINDTKEIAFNIASQCSPGSIICLVGDLGVGKTEFVKQFAVYFGIKEQVVSPTFTIVKEYNIQKNNIEKLIHFDVYRIENENQLDDIGFEEYIFANNICIIEWANLVKSRIPKNAIWIYISIQEDGKRVFEY